LPEAVAAMRAFTHVTEPDHQHRRKAESAIWEWEAELSGQRE
jgi:hypothetical protein